jgi:PAS domain S-box-containing protein
MWSKAKPNEDVMMSFRNLSLRSKQMLIMMVTASIALLLACTAIAIYEVVTFREAMVRNLSTLAEIVGDNTSAALDFNDAPSARETLSALQADSDIIGACVYTKEGEVFTTYSRANQTQPFAPPKFQLEGSSFGPQYLTLFRPIVRKSDVVGVVYLQADRHGLYSRLERYAGIVGLVFVAAMLFAFILSYRLQRVISEPILRLARMTRSVALEKNYSVRAIKQSEDELGQLIDGFNEMLAQIQQRDVALQTAGAELEVRVAQRTAELGTANEALQVENTERKQIELALQRQQTELRVLFDLMPALIWFKDTENRILRVNKRVAEASGKSVEQIEGKPSLEIYPHEAARFYADDLEVIRSGSPKLGNVETTLGADGKEQWVETDKVPYCDKDGKVIGIIVMSQDITQRKRLESQLFQSQKMETVGKLAGGIAHEFNSILTAIIGQSELLLGDLPPGSSLAKNATEISRAAGRAATLTRQLLAYGRKQILQPEILDLNRIIAGMDGMFHHLMGGDVTMNIVAAPDLKSMMADAGQIEQVILNMAINAREAMPNGGKLTLETANVSFDQESIGRYSELRAGDYVMLAITDTGAGMKDEVKARAFEPFFTTKAVGQGTGLGLSTCYGIVKQSGGHISVYSEPGRGTTFKIYLPEVKTQAAIIPPRLPSPELPRGTETILLVEDDPALREMAGTLLKRLGYTVWAAANGVEALSLKQQRSVGHIDLLFTDVVMPHMSGKELADRVQVLYPHTKILFTSAYTENAIVNQGVLNKGVVVLQKPFTPSALAHKLREILDQLRVPNPETPQKTLGFADSHVR